MDFLVQRFLATEKLDGKTLELLEIDSEFSTIL